MSVNQSELREKIREYLYNHPLRQPKEDIIEAFDYVPEGEVRDVLQELVEEGEVIEVNEEYQWKG